MRPYPIRLLAAALLVSVLLVGCNSGSPRYGSSFRTARDWVKACSAGNVRKATALTSVGADGLPPLCSYLGSLAETEQIKVAAVEDRGGQIIRSELYVIVQKESTSERAIFRLLLANADQHPVVFWAYFCDSRDWNCGYSEASSLIRIWY